MLIKILDSLRLCQSIIKCKFFICQTKLISFFITSSYITCKFQKLLDYFLIGKHSIKILIHCSLENFREFFRSDKICLTIDRNLFCNKLFQYLYRKILFFHIPYFFEEFWIEE